MNKKNEKRGFFASLFGGSKKGCGCSCGDIIIEEEEIGKGCGCGEETPKEEEDGREKSSCYCCN